MIWLKVTIQSVEKVNYSTVRQLGRLKLFDLSLTLPFQGEGI